MPVRVARVTDAAEVRRGGALFDLAPAQETTTEFLDRAGHHLLFAYDEADAVVGMVSGVEMTHPDKGTEMFLCELGVAERGKRQGIGTALVRALADLARERGCYGMWVLTDPDDDAGLATYRRAGALEESTSITLLWDLSGEEHDW
jgi:ribosomal protein S18 acetylase RimI-like enzyme